MIFQPARMMDKQTSQQEILDDLYHLLNVREQLALELRDEPMDIDDKKGRAILLKNNAVSILNKLIIHDFEIKQAIIDLIHQLDSEHGLT
ncbi:MAG: hypothetical protein ACTSYS_05125 [Promethearchaeota archaeon]